MEFLGETYIQIFSPLLFLLGLFKFVDETKFVSPRLHQMVYSWITSTLDIMAEASPFNLFHASNIDTDKFQSTVTSASSNFAQWRNVFGFNILHYLAYFQPVNVLNCIEILESKSFPFEMALKEGFGETKMTPMMLAELKMNSVVRTLLHFNPLMILGISLSG